jgi:hypothetical protein
MRHNPWQPSELIKEEKGKLETLAESQPGEADNNEVRRGLLETDHSPHEGFFPISRQEPWYRDKSLGLLFQMRLRRYCKICQQLSSLLIEKYKEENPEVKQTSGLMRCYFEENNGLYNFILSNVSY